ncbi:MAG TPA: endonuclease/exonuclease/phosphatase family protein [Roseovarius sp.]|nr:endonuclease/exonuclease/phosphatase family protein [Roseovarius sp.]
MRIASFNLQRLRLRDGRLSGARDGDTPETGGAAMARRDRALSARIIRDLDADLVVLQEVFDQATLDHFHDQSLLPLGLPAYPHRTCLPGNDGSGYDLALLARRAPLDVVNHADLRPADLDLRAPQGEQPDLPIFRRDCLRIELPGLTLFAVHFKAPYPDPERAFRIRALEAEATSRLIARRFADPAKAMWLILGDLNDPWQPADPPATAPIRPPFSVDLLERLAPGQRWTRHDAWSDSYGRPDAMLASPALARRCPSAKPQIHRQGLGREASRAPRHLPGTGQHRPHASDHAALVLDLPGF